MAGQPEVDRASYERLLEQFTDHVHCEGCGVPAIPPDAVKSEFTDVGTANLHRCVEHILTQLECGCGAWVGAWPNNRLCTLDGEPHECRQDGEAS